jgi:hypothetical protein
VSFERGVHDPALNAATPAMNESDLSEARRCRRVDILGDQRGDIARREGMKIELVFDRNTNGLF